MRVELFVYLIVYMFPWNSFCTVFLGMSARFVQDFSVRWLLGYVFYLQTLACNIFAFSKWPDAVLGLLTGQNKALHNYLLILRHFLHNCYHHVDLVMSMSNELFKKLKWHWYEFHTGTSSSSSFNSVDRILKYH